MSDIIDESIYDKSLSDPFEVGSHINTMTAIKQWDLFNDVKGIILITQFNLRNEYETRLILVVWDLPNVGNHDKRFFYATYP